MNADDIRSLCDTDEIYQRGLRSYHANLVRITENRTAPDQTTDNIGNCRVTATVRSKSGEGHYGVRLTMRGGVLLEGVCTCSDYSRRDGICSHIAAALLQLNLGAPRPMDAPPAAEQTSPLLRAVINSYTARAIANSLSREQGANIGLEPRLLINAGAADVEFRVVASRKYVVRNITTFAQAVQNRERADYGKNFSFVHDISSFDEASRPLVEFVLAKTAEDKAIERNFNPYSFLHKVNDRTLTLTPSSLDGFFDLMAGGELEVQLPNSEPFSVRLVEKNPHLTVQVTAAPAGALVQTPVFAALEGQRHCYVLLPHEGFFYRCDEEYTYEMKAFLTQVSRAGRPEGLFISETDLPAFCASVLPVLHRYAQVCAEGIALEDFSPPPAKISFYLDAPRRGAVTCLPQISYGGDTVNPLSRANREGLYRDAAAEYRLMAVLRRYFSQVDPKESCAVARHDDAIFRLLRSGVQELMALGEVYTSDGFRRLRLAPAPRLSVGVSLRQDLLQLDVTAAGVPQEELPALLESHRLRKKYHRLKDGRFLSLEDGGLDAFRELTEQLGVEQIRLQNGKLQLPQNRAFLVDTLLAGSPSIQLQRDSRFLALVDSVRQARQQGEEPPKALKGVLRPYQEAGFHWLSTLDRCGLAGILADDMGLGKTLQVIALLLANKGASDKPSLIVCPASLIYNWEEEISRFAPTLTTAVVAGTAEARRLILEQCAHRDVLITSYDLLKRDLDFYKAFTFRFLVIDEAQFIKNHATQSARAVKQIAAVTRFALTGTPIENRLSELWSIFDFLMPGLLGGYSRFHNEFELPIVRQEDTGALQRLHRITAPFVLRRLKRDVLKELPAKIEKTVFARLQGEQLALYQAAAKRLQNQISGQSGEDYRAGKIQILAQLTRLRQICCDPTLCFTDYLGESAKLETCLELVRNAVGGGHKVLLFSQFTSMLAIIQQRLREEGIPYYLLTGDTPKSERVSMAERFNHDGTPLFLISLKAGGTGLNLPAADIVIHYDPWWNLAAQNQATDRAHRIGQQNVVTVYKLIARGTIEEKIMALQESKRSLADSVVTEGAVSISSLSQEELLAILG